MVDWNRRARIAESILDTAGVTPMVRLRRVVGDVKPTIVAKVEYFNPSGSVKDRILPFLVSEAERRGDLRRGMTIIEGTTGNTGIATACVGAAKGYPVVIVMPDGMSVERKKTIRAYGAELVLTAGAESDVDLVIKKVKELKAAAPYRSALSHDRSGDLGANRGQNWGISAIPRNRRHCDWCGQISQRAESQDQNICG